MRKRPNLKDTTDVYFLIDVSLSMLERRLADAKSTLVELERSFLEDDRIAIISFDTNAYFKLKPRPVGQIRKQQELEPLLNRIFARGCTAIWDAIYMEVSQLRDKNKKTLMIVLIDGEDNSSSHTYQQRLDLVNECPGVILNIIHINGNGPKNPQYKNICKKRGKYKIIVETEIKITLTKVFRKYYN